MPARPRQDRWPNLVQAGWIVALSVGLALLVVVGLTEGAGKAANWAAVLTAIIVIVSGIGAAARQRRHGAAPATPEQPATTARCRCCTADM